MALGFTQTSEWGAELTLASLGQRIKKMRRDRQWTLEEAAERSNLAISTWSKVEKGQMSPTFDVLLKLAAGLETDIADLFRQPARPEVTGRRSITRARTGPVYASPTYDYEILFSELAHKKILPLHTRIRARTLSEFNGLRGHEGEEFIYVISGLVVLHTEFYAPTELGPGDSAYFDSTMPHALTAASAEDPMIIWVATEAGGGFLEHSAVIREK
jgi:transcriptional regulator with XRE-family HTH domain